MPKVYWIFAIVAGFASISAVCNAQAMPTTAGETLNGKRIVLAQAVHGRPAILIAGFSKDAGEGCGEWARAVRADPAFAHTEIYQVAMLEQAPGLLRGIIKSAMRKGLSATEQDRFLILTQDEKIWQTYFGVSSNKDSDKDPYAMLLDANGNILWHGHGAARNLEPLLRAPNR